MHSNFASLLPALITLVVAFATKRVLSSLFCGIVSAAFIASDFSVMGTFNLVIKRFWENTQLGTLASWKLFWGNWNLFICIFLTMLGVVITLISHSGGSYAYGKFVKKKLNSRRGAETSSLMLSLLLFVDDYFNSLTVGSVMHPLTDGYKIPRTKLAFLVDSMAAPLCILSPISSWVAMIMLQLKTSGVSDVVTSGTYIAADPFYIYVRLIPYIFYSFIIIASAFFIVRREISFGLMGEHEKIATETDNLFGGKKPSVSGVQSGNSNNKENSSIWDFILPILVLFHSVVIGILYSGGFRLLGGNRNLMQSFQNAEAPISLFVGGSITLIVSLAFYFYRRKLLLSDTFSVLSSGSRLMFPAICILIFAWTLGSLLNDDLLTGQYLAKLLVGNIDVRLFPVMFFFVSAATSFAIGSSWGTVAIMFPIAIPMVLSFMRITPPANINDISLVFPVLGAILSGSVSGDHISPISDTTIMSSTSTGSDHLDHVQTQFTYAFPAIISTGIAFVISGFISWWSIWANVLISLGTGLALCFAYLEIMNRRSK